MAKYYVVCTKAGRCKASKSPVWGTDFKWRRVVEAANSAAAIRKAKANK